jgi:hypothetical protein
MSSEMTSYFDSFGVPLNFFGHVDERFYGALGRIVALGALVELRICDLLMTIGDFSEADLAGLPIVQLQREFDGVVSSCKAADDAMPLSIQDCVTQAGAAMRKRNAMVHNVWANPSLEDGRGWRGVPKNQRSKADEPVEWLPGDEPYLTEVIGELVDVVSKLTNSLPVASGWRHLR